MTRHLWAVSILFAGLFFPATAWAGFSGVTPMVIMGIFALYAVVSFVAATVMVVVGTWIDLKRRNRPYDRPIWRLFMLSTVGMCGACVGMALMLGTMTLLPGWGSPDVGQTSLIMQTIEGATLLLPFLGALFSEVVFVLSLRDTAAAQR